MILCKKKEHKRIPIDLIEEPLFLRTDAYNRDYLLDTGETIYDIVVRPIENGKFRIIDGHGRFIKAKKEGKEEVDVIVCYDIVNEIDEIMLNIKLNTSVKPLSLKDTYRAIMIMREKGMTWEDIIKALNNQISKSTYYRLLALKDFPDDIKEAFLNEEIAIRYIDSIKKAQKKLDSDRIFNIIRELLKEEDLTPDMRGRILEESINELIEEKRKEILENVINGNKEDHEDKEKDTIEIEEHNNAIDIPKNDQIEPFFNEVLTNVTSMIGMLKEQLENTDINDKDTKKRIKKVIRYLEKIVDTIIYGQ